MDTGAFEENLRKRGIVLKVFDTKEDAASYLTQTIKGKTVGFGGSMTLEEMASMRNSSRKTRFTGTGVRR